MLPLLVSSGPESWQHVPICTESMLGVVDRGSAGAEQFESWGQKVWLRRVRRVMHGPAVGSTAASCPPSAFREAVDDSFGTSDFDPFSGANHCMPDMKAWEDV